MNKWNDFIDDISQFDFIKLTQDEAIHDWGNDIPITLLFSAIGKCIRDNFDCLTQEEQINILNKVEIGIVTGNEELQAYIATGLLESLSAKKINNLERWNRIEALLGAVSKKYLFDLDQFYGAN